MLLKKLKTKFYYWNNKYIYYIINDYNIIMIKCNMKK